MNKSLVIKPIVTSIVLLSAVIALGVIGAAYSSRVSMSISQQTLPALSHLSNSNQYRGQSFLYTVRMLNATSDDEYRDAAAKIGFYSGYSINSLQLYEKSITTDENRNLYNDVVAERDAYVDARDKLIALGKEGDRSGAFKEFNERLLPMYERYLDKSQKLVEYASNEGVQRANSIRTVSIWLIVFSIISSAVIFIFGFVLGYTR